MSVSLIFDLLQKSKEEKKIISVWKYNDDTGFFVGFVIDFNEEMFTLQHFTKYGKSDGIIVERIEAIKSIDFDDDYSRSMKYLIENSSLLDTEDEIKINLTHSKDWQLEILRQLEGNKDAIASVEINRSDYYSGFIIFVSENDFLINCIGKNGEDEGKVIYKLEDVTSLRVNDIEARRRKLLHLWRKSQVE